jgi:hypothetical protein
MRLTTKMPVVGHTARPEPSPLYHGTRPVLSCRNPTTIRYDRDAWQLAERAIQHHEPTILCVPWPRQDYTAMIGVRTAPLRWPTGLRSGSQNLLRFEPTLCRRRAAYTSRPIQRCNTADEHHNIQQEGQGVVVRQRITTIAEPYQYSDDLRLRVVGMQSWG